jgi:hypothetical protein
MITYKLAMRELAALAVPGAATVRRIPCDAESCEAGCALPDDCLGRPQRQARPDVAALPVAGMVMVRGYPCRVIDQPTEAEMRALAHALTVQADRVAMGRGK